MKDKWTVIGMAVMLGLAGVLGILIASKFSGRSNYASGDEVPVRVTATLRHDGHSYLLWSNGQITPDMAEQQATLLRALAAQSLLKQSNK